LKVLAAAGGGITAAAFLPAKWVKPIVNSGVLPVHAQASGLGRIWGKVTGATEGTQVDFYVESRTMKTGLKVAKPKRLDSKTIVDGGSVPGDYTTLTDSAGNYSKDLPLGTYTVGSRGCFAKGEFTLTNGANIEVNISGCYS
jgi:hypothetical protein